MLPFGQGYDGSSDSKALPVWAHAAYIAFHGFRNAGHSRIQQKNKVESMGWDGREKIGLFRLMAYQPYTT